MASFTKHIPVKKVTVAWFRPVGANDSDKLMRRTRYAGGTDVRHTAIRSSISALAVHLMSSLMHTCESNALQAHMCEPAQYSSCSEAASSINRHSRADMGSKIPVQQLGALYQMVS